MPRSQRSTEGIGGPGRGGRARRYAPRNGVYLMTADCYVSITVVRLGPGRKLSLGSRRDRQSSGVAEAAGGAGEGNDTARGSGDTGEVTGKELSETEGDREPTIATG